MQEWLGTTTVMSLMMLYSETELWCLLVNSPFGYFIKWDCHVSYIIIEL